MKFKYVSIVLIILLIGLMVSLDYADQYKRRQMTVKIEGLVVEVMEKEAALMDSSLNLLNKTSEKLEEEIADLNSKINKLSKEIEVFKARELRAFTSKAMSNFSELIKDIKHMIGGR
ncbi:MULTISPECIES: hypothetical protein [unclassified Fusibacter]|uniref:hypothetical protein n=1 Tax=unclassified Fusibacter TaxID=2624464 RepID=UPI0010122AA3|nr:MULTISPECIES: hypothetical protein [unclassified Fusibacter]MCK8058953.1 hypothetical protein [Fusibacter sp. A2]NPE22029.1 hypothetical protein [Fusibacter sp. A1]RXV61593.1 hypothetical protein DWB64_09300 [Fusibacter sp. A1]